MSMTNSGDLPGIVPAAICWLTEPVLDGLYSLATGVYPFGLAASTGTMLLSSPPTPGCDQAPLYHLDQEPPPILPEIGARATCAKLSAQLPPLSTRRDP